VPVTTEALNEAFRRAHALFRNRPAWLAIQHNGMAVDVSWRNRARQYAMLYRQLVKAR
jgi:starch synthase